MGDSEAASTGCHGFIWTTSPAIYQFALNTPVSGALNGVAPNPVTNADFTRLLAAAVHRPALFPVPGFALRLLFGEMGGILLASQRVTPKAAQTAGFTFRFGGSRTSLGRCREGLRTPEANLAFSTVWKKS
ncbi:MAG: DUF1731 domain-containing protein [Ignavibacteriota bacterium]